MQGSGTGAGSLTASPAPVEGAPVPVNDVATDDADPVAVEEDARSQESDRSDESELAPDELPVPSDDPILGSAVDCELPAPSQYDPTPEVEEERSSEPPTVDTDVPGDSDVVLVPPAASGEQSESSLVSSSVNASPTAMSKQVLSTPTSSKSASGGCAGDGEGDEDWEVVELSRSGIGSPTVYTTECQLVRAFNPLAFSDFVCHFACVFLLVFPCLQSLTFSHLCIAVSLIDPWSLDSLLPQIMPIAVVVGRLELSATHISFYPERFADDEDDTYEVDAAKRALSSKDAKKKVWVPDNASDVCGGCHNPILPGLFLTRKHHCRRCVQCSCERLRRLLCPPLSLQMQLGFNTFSCDSVRNAYLSMSAVMRAPLVDSPSYLHRY